MPASCRSCAISRLASSTTQSASLSSKEPPQDSVHRHENVSTDLQSPHNSEEPLTRRSLSRSSSSQDTVLAATPPPPTQSTLPDRASFLDVPAASRSPGSSRLSDTPPALASVPSTVKHDDGASEASSSSKGKGKARQTRIPEEVPLHEVEPLAEYTCPVCFSPPTYATITPCGHVLCGECLFTAVKTTIQRGAYTMPHGQRMAARWASVRRYCMRMRLTTASYRCPVCRATIPGWDGRGGGVIGLKPRAVFSL